MNPNTTLFMMARDEEQNPAGGIEKVLRWTLPHFSSAFVYNTGSIDMTPEILKELQKEFPYLQFETGEFKGFAASRNQGLDHIRRVFPDTKYVFDQDADELVADDPEPVDGYKYFSVSKGFEELAKFVKENPSSVYQFHTRNLRPDGVELITAMGVRTSRLFKIEDAKYGHFMNKTYDLWECLTSPKNDDYTPFAPTMICHFLPPTEAVLKKQENWYNSGAFMHEQLLSHAQNQLLPQTRNLHLIQLNKHY